MEKIMGFLEEMIENLGRGLEEIIEVKKIVNVN
jgi:hypothetical protein